MSEDKKPNDSKLNKKSQYEKASLKDIEELKMKKKENETVDKNLNQKNTDKKSDTDKSDGD